MPDATTLSRFWIDLAEAGRAETVLDALDRQLEQRGLVIEAGTMIAATLVEADVKRPPMREVEVSARDPAAGFTRRGQRSFLGTRVHLAVDHRSSADGRSIPARAATRRWQRGSDLIRKAILTSAGIGPERRSRCPHLRRQGGRAGGQGV